MTGKISAYQNLMLKIASMLPEKMRTVFLHPAGKRPSNLNFFKKKIIFKFVEEHEKKVVPYRFLRSDHCIFLGTVV